MDGFIVIYEPLIDKNITKMLVMANMNITKGTKTCHYVNLQTILALERLALALEANNISLFLLLVILEESH